MSDGKKQKDLMKPLGVMVMIMAIGSLGLALTFFMSDNLIFMQFNFSGDEDYFGWVFMIISMGLASIALFLFIKMAPD